MVKSNQGLYFIETWNKIKGLHFERDIFRIAFYVHQGEITPQNEEAKVHKNLASNDFTIQVTSSCYYIYHVSNIKVFKDTLIILVLYSQNARFSFIVHKTGFGADARGRALLFFMVRPLPFNLLPKLVLCILGALSRVEKKKQKKLFYI